MQRELRQTADGSHTLAITGTDITYHSHHGAMAESMHVCIEGGLRPVLSRITSEPICIFEMGFGTGLNALLTLQEAEQQRKQIRYYALEPFPLTTEEFTQLNYGTLLQAEEKLLALHRAAWNCNQEISPFFILHKIKASLLEPFHIPAVHCIYYDAFAPTYQPELWTKEVFKKLYALLQPGGILLTYCSKTEVRHAMSAAGFAVEKIPGPRGKREMVRAWRGGFAN